MEVHLHCPDWCLLSDRGSQLQTWVGLCKGFGREAPGGLEPGTGWDGSLKGEGGPLVLKTLSIDFLSSLGVKMWQVKARWVIQDGKVTRWVATLCVGALLRISRCHCQLSAAGYNLLAVVSACLLNVPADCLMLRGLCPQFADSHGHLRRLLCTERIWQLCLCVS